MDELEYRRLLKALAPDIEPERDLFPGIAARLDVRASAARRDARPLFPFAAANMTAFFSIARRVLPKPVNR